MFGANDGAAPRFTILNKEEEEEEEEEEEKEVVLVESCLQMLRKKGW